jgi:hypothetical protein
MFLNNLMSTYLEFLYAPVIYPKMLWILLPTLWAILLMELYFDRYSREGIGHHKSLENTIFLVFISANLLYVSLTHSILLPKLYLSISFIIFSIVIGTMDFFHKLPTKLILKGSSKFIVGFISYVVIVLIYSEVLYDLNLLTAIVIIVSIVLLFLTFLLVLKFIDFFEPKSYDEIEHFLKNIEQDIKKAHEESIKEFGDTTKSKKIVEKKEELSKKKKNPKKKKNSKKN